MDQRHPGCGFKKVFFCTPNRLICGPFCERAKNALGKHYIPAAPCSDGWSTTAIQWSSVMACRMQQAGWSEWFRQEGKPSMEYRGLEPSFMLVQPVEFRRVVDRFDYCCTAWSDVTEYLDRHTDRLLGLAGTDGKCWVHPGLVEEATTQP
jgi:hypothetical protein